MHAIVFSRTEPSYENVRKGEVQARFHMPVLVFASTPVHFDEQRILPAA
jgi:hypothetical protein